MHQVNSKRAAATLLTAHGWVSGHEEGTPGTMQHQDLTRV